VKYLIAGGAGFIGSNLAKYFIEGDSDPEVVVIDNLYRRGSEMNLGQFSELGIRFHYCDVRNYSAVRDIIHKESMRTPFDVVIDCVAEPAVKAGSGEYYSEFDNLIQTNLNGTINLLKAVSDIDLLLTRTSVAFNPPLFVFLSTSRVYSIDMLNETHRDVEVSERAPTTAPRSYYGTTKLAAELFVQEICSNNAIPYLINRCGIVAGPGQFGKVDQGVISLWVMSKFFGRELKYTGFGGRGEQTRDALHVLDLADAISLQISEYCKSGICNQLLNIGGGTRNSFTLKELTAIVNTISDSAPLVVKDGDYFTDKFDVISYITDFTGFSKVYPAWSGPKRSIADICKDTYTWVEANQSSLRKLF
jgi:CDP-paratose 2-epimerase